MPEAHVALGIYIASNFELSLANEFFIGLFIIGQLIKHVERHLETLYVAVKYEIIFMNVEYNFERIPKRSP